VESTLTSQVMRPAASAIACNAVKICCQVPLRYVPEPIRACPTTRNGLPAQRSSPVMIHKWPNAHTARAALLPQLGRVQVKPGDDGPKTFP
jgi:hypothetical protein